MAVDTNEKITNWLYRFGYLKTLTPTDDEIAAAVKAMQNVYRLETDGWAGPITQRAMSMFRCWHPDANIVPATVADAAPLVGDRCRWKQPVVRYAIADDFDIGIDLSVCRTIFAAGFEVYQPLTGLTFVETERYEDADIQISAASGRDHGFDGVGNVLALSTLPCGEVYRKLRCVFDKAEPWTQYMSGPGVSLQAVWAHELGHLVGLSHSANPEDAMSPYYTPSIVSPQLNDRWRLSVLYNVPFIPPSNNVYDTGAYRVDDGMVVVRHDGGVMISLRRLSPAQAHG